MDTGKLLKGYAQTKGHITSAVLGAAGWDMHRYDVVAASGPQVFLYVFDKPTGFTWMASVSREEFVRISSRAHQERNRIEAVRYGVTNILHLAAAGKPPEPLDGVDWEVQLSVLLAAYAGTTQTWVQADRFRGGGHFVVLNYRKSMKDDTGTLRPFALGNTGDTVLSAEKLQGYIRQVLEIDQAKHPEWFD